MTARRKTSRTNRPIDLTNVLFLTEDIRTPDSADPLAVEAELVRTVGKRQYADEPREVETLDRRARFPVKEFEVCELVNATTERLADVLRVIQNVHPEQRPLYDEVVRQRKAETHAANMQTLQGRLNDIFDNAVQAARLECETAIDAAQKKYHAAYAAADRARSTALEQARKEREAAAPQVVELDRVASVYSGSGSFTTCACGCKGKYTYASAHTHWSGIRRGDAIDPSEVNDRTVKTIVHKINLAFADLIPDVIETRKDKHGHWIGAVVGNRVYVAHLKY